LKQRDPPSVVLHQSKHSPHARVATRSGGAAKKARTASAIRLGVVSGKMHLASGAATISAMSSMSETMMAVLQAMLSSRTLGQPSEVDTSKSRSAAV
jgi:hypothetical protein